MGYPRNNCPTQAEIGVPQGPSTLIRGRILAAPNILSSSLPCFADWSNPTYYLQPIAYNLPTYLKKSGALTIGIALRSNCMTMLEPFEMLF